jgi:Zn-dependent M28 family amino/carboxypeptidase
VTAVDLQLGLGNASTSGCDFADFAGFPAGDIALIQRGVCTFRVKAENAAAAGATGAIIFNQGNTPDRLGLVNGTLSASYAGGIPVFDATYARGAEWAATPGLVLSMFANVSSGPVTTYNVIAETSAGDPGKIIMAGAHLDSVPDGPGINDNGSGSAALLETAVQMAKVKPLNKVRFAWWGAEEIGLLGSTFYINGLSTAQRNAISAYLNFDMIGSPNYVRFVLDGDHPSAPVGSAAIKSFFASFYGARGLEFEPVLIFNSTDTAPFIAAGIPVGGVFTGAAGVKTAEEAAIYGGTAGVQYDPCYHLACDTFDNVSLEVLDLNADAVATSVLHFANLKTKKTKKVKPTALSPDQDNYGHLLVK